jgi:glutathione S-transferase
MKIYGDASSGNCLKVKWVCDKLSLPYNWIDVDGSRAKHGRPNFSSLTARDKCRSSNLMMAARWPNPTPSFDLIPADAFATAKMDEWLFWEQYRHEPYIAVCRFQMFYLGKLASQLDPEKVARGYAALARMEQQLALGSFLVGDAFSLADVALLAYTSLAHEGGFHLDDYPAVAGGSAMPSWRSVSDAASPQSLG